MSRVIRRGTRDIFTDLGGKSAQHGATLASLLDMIPSLQATNAREEVTRSVLLLMGTIIVAGSPCPRCMETAVPMTEPAA
jgi:hypothetical protein